MNPKSKNKNYQRYLKALEMAVVAHSGYFRRDGCTPYILHSLRVAEHFVDPFMKSIAVLHDTIEDTTVTYPDILSICGVTVANVVRILTHFDSMEYAEYIYRISKSKLATKVKIADILDNLSDDPTDKQKHKYEQALRMLKGK